MDTRAPPPAAPPPSYAVISRVYRHSLRPIVLSVSAVSLAYAAVCGGGAFSDISDDRTISSHIATLDIVMGALYMGVLLVELFGIFSVVKQIASAVRTYCFLTLFAALLVMTAEMVHVVIHFKYKHTIINNCISVVTTSGEFCDGPFCRDHPLSLHDGTNYCNDRWSRRSFSDIAWFLVASVFSLLFSTFAWGYLHQLQAVGTRLDAGPGVGAAEGRIGSAHIPLQTYNASHTPQYDPPAYPPPGHPRDSTDEDAHLHAAGTKVPEYDGYNAGDYLHGGKDEKAPGYDLAVSGKGHSRSMEEDEDEDEHGPPVQDNNPYHRSP